MGHVIEKGSVKPLNDNLASIKQFPIPKTKKNVRQFLGKINFYHKYIPNVALLLEPFHYLLLKNFDFHWSPQCQQTFDCIKEYLMSTPILTIFDRHLPVHIYTDASQDGIGAVLKQIQPNGEEKPVAYFSKKLNEVQRKRKAIYIESYAIREAIKFWKYWLLGTHFTVFTDHKPLENLNIKSRTDEELGDLTNYLLQFDFQVVYKPGKSMVEADYLSRNPVFESSQFDNEDKILTTVNVLQLDEIKDSQKLIKMTRNDQIKDGIILRKIKNRKKIVLDEEKGYLLTNRLHASSGHIGSKHLMNTISPY